MNTYRVMANGYITKDLKASSSKEVTTPVTRKVK